MHTVYTFILFRVKTKKMGKTAYKKSWENEFPWISPVKKDIFKAYCKTCLKVFKIDGSGICQVRSHAKCHTSEKPQNQRTFSVNSSGSLELQAKTNIQLCPEDLVIKAEILQALNFVDNNYSFASAGNDNARFKEMFPDSNIAKSYAQSETKMKYMIQFGLAPYLKEKLIYDVNNTPFTFKFDETTNRQVQKQYDGYLQYWSKERNEVANAYCGSLFIRHCTADNLLQHYEEFTHKLNLDSSLLLHLGMDGPNVNLSFERKLIDSLESEVRTSILKLGSCSLHPVHTAYRKGIAKISFDVDPFFHDLHFFFKYSSGRREDYVSMAEITGITAEFAKKHTETRWLSMKYTCVRLLEQWDKVCEYFLTFLPKEKNFKSGILPTQRYKHIKDALLGKLTHAYVSFCAFAAEDFENFLLPFQSSEPMIHLLFPEICKLLTNLMCKFIKKKVLSKDASENLEIDVCKSTNCKSASFVEIGTKARLLVGDRTLITNELTETFRKSCLSFFVTAIHYLQVHLPHSTPVIKHAQFLHPEKRTLPGATNAISNLSLKVTTVVENKLCSVFKVNKDVSKESVVDMIRTQWMMYQNEDLPESFYLCDTQPLKSGPVQFSYWRYALEKCALKEKQETNSKYKRIDHFWSKVGSLTDDNGCLKYTQLFCLIKCVLSLSHGNSVPERGFSINKLLLESHGYTLQGDTIEALRLVRDEIICVGGVMQFPITKKLIAEAKCARTRYQAHLSSQRDLEEKEMSRKQQVVVETAARQEKRNELEQIEAEISKIETCMTAATEIIEEGNEKLQEALSTKGKLDRNLVQRAQSKIEIGIDRKLEGQLDILMKKKRSSKHEGVIYILLKSIIYIY